MALAKHVKEFRGQATVVASMDVGALWDRMLGEFLDEWARLQRTGASLAEIDAGLESFLNALSDKPEIALARKSASVAYNQGRAAEIQSRRDVEFVVRSEVLDTNTCIECSAVDGEVFEVNSPDFFNYMPPALCLGGDLCRGLYIAVPGGSA